MGIRRDAFLVLKAIHRTIKDHCHENDRRCWEYLVEMLALSTGWQTESCESKHLWDKMADDIRWLEFFECWMDEVQTAKENRTSFSEPVGELLEELEGANRNLSQVFTPMSLARLLEEMTMPESSVPIGPNGKPSTRGMEPCCGTGRILINALVHNDGLFMHAMDIDLWMLRTAMLNVRMLCKWTSSRIQTKELLNPFNVPEDTDKQETVIILAGRAIFMHGDSLVVDTAFRPNWMCARWAWSPKPWQSNLKITGFLGSLNEWESAGKPLLEDHNKPGEIQFDYSMKKSVKGKDGLEPRQLQRSEKIRHAV